MFESFKPRSEEIAQEKFSSFLEDPEFTDLVKTVEDTMMFTTEDGDQSAHAFEPQDGYEEALQEAQNWLDKKGQRISTGALARAIAKNMDPDGVGGFEALI